MGNGACDRDRVRGEMAEEVAQGAQEVDDDDVVVEGAGGSAAPPGWKKTMNFGKRTGYVGRNGQRVTELVRRRVDSSTS